MLTVVPFGGGIKALGFMFYLIFLHSSFHIIWIFFFPLFTFTVLFFNQKKSYFDFEKKNAQNIYLGRSQWIIFSKTTFWKDLCIPLWGALAWEVMLSVTVSRPPDSIPWVSASVSVTLASPPTPDEDMTRFWVEMADGDIGVVEGRLPLVVLSSTKEAK